MPGNAKKIRSLRTLPPSTHSVTVAMTHILDLDLEVFHLIVEELRLQDIRTLRLICKQFAAHLATHIYRNIVISFNIYNRETELDKVKILANGNPKASMGARSLFIKGLNPAFAPYHLRSFGAGKAAFHPASTMTPEQVLMVLRDTLFAAISSLSGIQSVTWEPNYNDEISVQQLAFQAILTLSRLRHFTFHNVRSSTPIHLPLSSLPPLHSLSLTGAYDETRAGDFFTEVAKLVSISPALSHFQIFGGICPGKPLSPSQSVSYLFSRCTDLQSTLSLSGLHISDILFRLDHLTLPYLRNLRSFTLEYTRHPFSGNSTTFSSTESLLRLEEIQNTRSELLKWGSTRTEIWEALRREEIWLSEIKTNHVCHAFLVYLESYQTLEKLELAASNFQDEESSNIAAMRFFDRSIMGHTQSLRHFSVRAPYEGRWSYEPSQSGERIIQFTNLEHLEVGVNPGDLRPPANGDEPRLTSRKNNTDEDIVKSLLGSVVCHLPLVDTLRIFEVEYESERHEICSYGADYYYTQRRMHACVLNYRSPSNCRRLPSLYVALDSKFEPISGSDADAGRQAYQLVAGELPDSYFGLFD